jgi:hypothetical protein
MMPPDADDMTETQQGGVQMRNLGNEGPSENDPFIPQNPFPPPNQSPLREQAQQNPDPTYSILQYFIPDLSVDPNPSTGLSNLRVGCAMIALIIVFLPWDFYLRFFRMYPHFKDPNMVDNYYVNRILKYPNKAGIFFGNLVFQSLIFTIQKMVAFLFILRNVCMSTFGMDFQPAFLVTVLVTFILFTFYSQSSIVPIKWNPITGQWVNGDIIRWDWLIFLVHVIQMSVFTWAYYSINNLFLVFATVPISVSISCIVDITFPWKKYIFKPLAQL